ncbi:hypothetical protein [Hymenobacter latericus]|uniref:hypothetical protein n=1 Tax=Hymenobacter sp. YIM 151858-1 TaxID=2987688 RepID=UPI00222673F7|nr:hypothetical protein [Hymenobacter sp. YIM 151858-1]UYZ58337.1 hypothetical protein OIS50_14875 [Hymenobacter sp. YIM 151858-1]
MDDLRNTDPEDINDVLKLIEKSFSIRFGQTDFQHVVTFGELCDVVVDKLKQRPFDNSCTSQQAFYKLRGAIKAVGIQFEEQLAPQTSLSFLLPRLKRRKYVAQLQHELGLSLNWLLTPKWWIVSVLAVVSAGSLIYLFIDASTGVLAFAASLAGWTLAFRLGRELQVKTVGQLVTKLMQEHYAQMRRQSNTVNHLEVPELLRQLFADRLYLNPTVLTREATIN